jgi:hypothetical protein
MKRSGHHAFINWVCEQNGNIKFINNAINGWENKEYKQPPHSGGKTVVYGNGKDLCVNVEDFDIDDYYKFGMDKFSIKEKSNVYEVVFVRNFKNWLSSSLKRREYKYPHNDVYVSLDKEFSNDRRETKPSRIKLYEKQIRIFENNNTNFILVSYDRWIKDIDYRKDIAGKLNLNFTDAGIDKMSSYGKGSSFTQMNEQDTSKLGTDNRYKSFEGDKEYEGFMEKYSNINKLSEKYL